MDMHIEVPAVPYKELRSKADAQCSAQIRERVEEAREKQRQRGFYNAQVPPSQLRTLCALDESGERTLEMAVRRMNLSARAHDRMLRVARTIADLDHSETVSAKHFSRSGAVQELGSELLELSPRFDLLFKWKFEIHNLAAGTGITQPV